MPISRGGNLQNNRRTLLSAMICVSVFLSLFSTSTLAGRTSSEAPVITSKATASGTVGIAFSYQITATNTPTSYSATGLPTGLTINSRTGLISGTPTAAGTSTVTIAADQPQRYRDCHPDTNRQPSPPRHHQRHDRERNSRKRLLLSDHCHQFTHQLWRHGFARGPYRKQHDRIDLRHALRGRNVQRDP